MLVSQGVEAGPRGQGLSLQPLDQLPQPPRALSQGGRCGPSSATPQAGTTFGVQQLYSELDSPQPGAPHPLGSQNRQHAA